MRQDVRKPARIPEPVFDAAVAAVVAALGAIGIVVWAGTTRQAWPEITFAVAVLLAQSVPLVSRRNRPAHVLAIVSAAFLVHEPLASPVTPFALLIAVYSVAAYGSRRVSLLTVGAVLPLITAYLTARALFLTDRITQRDVITFAFATFGAWALGNGVGARRAYRGALEERARLLERSREQEAHRAVQAERARIARELHDVVAHHVSMMVVQSGGARRIIDTDPRAASAAMAAVEQTGRDALGEMRRLLGALRADEAGGLTPQPGAAQIDALVEQTRAAGISISRRIEGKVRELPTLVDLAVYRLVQEALTNVVKHAAGAPASVVVRYGRQAVEVEVSDEGPTYIDSPTGSGHGLTGMRERVTLLGGHFSAGPRVGGGFAVRATIPVEDGGDP